MEAAEVRSVTASPQECDALVIYKGAWQFVVAVGLTSFFAFPALFGAIVGNLCVLVVYGAMALGLAFVAGQHCSRVELYRDGKVVLRFFVRRSVTTSIEAVSRIARDEEDGEWYVSYDDGSFRMSRNESATSLVHALMRRKPTIALSGYTLPEL